MIYEEEKFHNNSGLCSISGRKETTQIYKVMLDKYILHVKLWSSYTFIMIDAMDGSPDIFNIVLDGIQDIWSLLFS
jgi:hypothetical protein